MRRKAMRLVAALLVVGRLWGQGELPKFEVGTIKLLEQPAGRGSEEIGHGSLTFSNRNLWAILSWAYDIESVRIVLPEWARTTYYEVAAKAGSPAPEDQLRLMLRALLAERLKMVSHIEQRPMSFTAMVAGKNGIHSVDLRPGVPSLQPASECKVQVMERYGKLRTIAGTSMKELARIMSAAGPLTIDQTGLAGCFDITTDVDRYMDPSIANRVEANTTALRGAAEAALGVKFEQKKIPLDVLVVDHVEKTPTGN